MNMTSNPETTTATECFCEMGHECYTCGSRRRARRAAAERQEVRGACPATGRSASVCADQSHARCYEGRREMVAFDAKVAKAIR